MLEGGKCLVPKRGVALLELVGRPQPTGQLVPEYRYTVQ
jgi:hypothetical protein